MREVRDFVRLVHVYDNEISHYRRVFIAALVNELPLAPEKSAGSEGSEYSQENWLFLKHLNVRRLYNEKMLIFNILY